MMISNESILSSDNIYPLTEIESWVYYDGRISGAVRGLNDVQYFYWLADDQQLYNGVSLRQYYLYEWRDPRESYATPAEMFNELTEDNPPLGIFNEDAFV